MQKGRINENEVQKHENLHLEFRFRVVLYLLCCLQADAIAASINNIWAVIFSEKALALFYTFFTDSSTHCGKLVGKRKPSGN